MYLKPGGSFAFQTLLNSTATGSLSDADALPTALLTRNGVDDTNVAVTVTKLSTGRYKATGALPNTYAAGDVCQVVVTATVGGVIGASVAGEFVIDTAFHADIPGLVWDTLTNAARAAGSYGAKIKAWALGTDNRALLSTDASNTALLGSGEEGVLTSLSAMIAANKFTPAALSNAPAGSGGGSGPTVAQIAAGILATPANLLATDATGKVLLQSAQAQTLTPVAPAAILTAFKADADWQTMLANVNGVFDYNETTRVLTLKDKTATTTLATLTLTPGVAAITHRASA